MIKKIFKKNPILNEYYGEGKFIYHLGKIEVFNYNNIISIDNEKVILSGLTIGGINLKVIYQDPVKITIKGDIDSIMMSREKWNIE